MVIQKPKISHILSLPETAMIECLSAIVSMIFQKERILISDA